MEESRSKLWQIFHIISRHRSLWDYLKAMCRSTALRSWCRKKWQTVCRWEPGTKEYGALSLAVQYYAKPEIVAIVPPNCFMPRPNVGSAVIRLTRHKEVPVQVNDEKLMFKIIRASFNQRRKTLANGLNNAAGHSSFQRSDSGKH